MQRRVYLLTLLVAGLVTAPILLQADDRSSALAPYLRSHGLDAPTSNYTIVSREDDTVSGIQWEEVQATNDGRELHLTVLSPAGAAFTERYLRDRRRQIMSAYMATPAPYAGIPTEDIDCPERFRPQIDHITRGGTNYTYLALYANQEMNIGACTDATARYAVQILQVYCPAAETILVAERYRPRGEQDTDTFIDAIRCN